VVREPAAVLAGAPVVPVDGVVSTDAPGPDEPPTPAGPPPPDPRRLRVLRRGLGAEVAIGAVVLVLTTILVNTAQAKEVQAAAGPASYSTLSTGAQANARLIVKPPRTGSVAFTLQIRSPAGKVIAGKVTSAALTLPAAGIGPLPVSFGAEKAGAFTARADIAKPGSWLLDVTIQTSPIEATAFQLTIPIH